MWVPKYMTRSGTQYNRYLGPIYRKEPCNCFYRTGSNVCVSLWMRRVNGSTIGLEVHRQIKPMLCLLFSFICFDWHHLRFTEFILNHGRGTDQLGNSRRSADSTTCGRPSQDRALAKFACKSITGSVVLPGTSLSRAKLDIFFAQVILQ